MLPLSYSLTLSHSSLARAQASRPSFLLYLRHAFRHPSLGGGLRKRDFSAIEYMLRRGERMVSEVFEDVGVKRVGLPRGAGEWWEGMVRGRRGGEEGEGAK